MEERICERDDIHKSIFRYNYERRSLFANSEMGSTLYTVSMYRCVKIITSCKTWNWNFTFTNGLRPREIYVGIRQVPAIRISVSF